MTKYIFVTGGVVSSLGKGVTSASLGALLEAYGFKITLVKLDPYINVDPGTMSPFQHGEVFVTEDGAETDLDLGYYERFTNIKMTKDNNLTSGRVYAEVIKKERHGDYLGATVQVIPHITDVIKNKIKMGAIGNDIAIIEIGGTVGDIESLPFLESIRQMRIELGTSHTFFIHLTLVPFISSTNEIKTKPTQHSVKEMRSIGIQPDMLICRSHIPIDNIAREKIALFTNVEYQAVISLPDVDDIYHIPIQMNKQRIGETIIKKMQLPLSIPDMHVWEQISLLSINITNETTIAMVGKYIDLHDAYKSINEALKHAGLHTNTKVNIKYIDAEYIEKNGTDILVGIDGILIPGGFGKRGIEGMIMAAQFARENNIPYLGICLGLQVAVIEFARNIAKMQGANSTEFDPYTQYPVIALITEWSEMTGKIEYRNQLAALGGTMRLGKHLCHVVSESLVNKIYGTETIIERYRHRYEVNCNLISILEKYGLFVSGRSSDGNLVEVIEIKNHKWFLCCQFHPEFTSNPKCGHPLFISYIKASQNNKI